MEPSNNPKKANVRHTSFPELAHSMIKDYMCQVKSGHEYFALMFLAEQTMAQAAWREGDERGIEKIFETCKTLTLRNLRHRLDRWQSKVAAVQTQNQAAH